MTARGRPLTVRRLAATGGRRDQRRKETCVNSEITALGSLVLRFLLGLATSARAVISC